jgi:hypothetical protein
MVRAELGLHLTRDGDRWRCVEYPEFVILRGGGHEVDGREFDSLAEAVKFFKGEPRHRPVDGPSRPIRHGYCLSRCPP